MNKVSQKISFGGVLRRINLLVAAVLFIAVAANGQMQINGESTVCDGLITTYNVQISDEFCGSFDIDWNITGAGNSIIGADQGVDLLTVQVQWATTGRITCLAEGIPGENRDCLFNGAQGLDVTVNPESILTNVSGGFLKESIQAIEWRSPAKSGTVFEIHLDHPDATIGTRLLGTQTFSGTENCYDHAFSWNLDETIHVADGYTLRIENSYNSTSITSGTFEITSNYPESNFTTPSSAANWKKGDAFTISWADLNGNFTYDLKLQDEAGSDVQSINVAQGASSIQWTVPTSLASGKYHLNLVSSSGKVFRTEEPLFICSVCIPPNITTPTTNAGLKQWTEIPIQWSYPNDGETFEVYVNDGTSQLVGTTNAYKSGESYYEVILNLRETQVLDGAFTILVMGGPDQMEHEISVHTVAADAMSFPNSSADFMEIGTEYPIQWNGAAGTTYDLFLQRENGTFVSPSSPLLTITGNEALWTPNVVEGRYHMIVVSADNSESYRSASSFLVCADCKDIRPFGFQSLLVATENLHLDWTSVIDADPTTFQNVDGYEIYIESTSGEYTKHLGSIQNGTTDWTGNTLQTWSAELPTKTTTGLINYTVTIYPDPRELPNVVLKSSDFHLAYPLDQETPKADLITNGALELVNGNGLNSYNIFVNEDGRLVQHVVTGYTGTDYTWHVGNFNHNTQYSLIVAADSDPENVYKKVITLKDAIPLTAEGFYERGVTNNITWSFPGTESQSNFIVFLEKMNGEQVVNSNIIDRFNVGDEITYKQDIGKYCLEWNFNEQEADGIYRFRIKGTTGQEETLNEDYQQYISNNFEIRPNSSPIGLDFPIGGETLYKNWEPKIKWRYPVNGAMSFDIQILNRNVQVHQFTHNVTTASADGTYEAIWDISIDMESNPYYRVRITPSDGGSPFLSANQFEISDFPLEVPSFWPRGKEKTISWDQVQQGYTDGTYSSDPHTFAPLTQWEVLLWRYDGSPNVTTIHEGTLPVIEGKFTFPWIPPFNQTPSSKYVFEVKSVENGSASYGLMSDGYFKIRDLYTTFPSGGEKLSREFDYNISWKYEDMEPNTSFTVYLQRYDDPSYSLNLGNTGPLQVSIDDFYDFNWTVPLSVEDGEEYYIYIMPSVTGPRVRSVSFSVGIPGLLSPNGGGRWSKNESYPVRWHYHTPGTAFELFLDNGETFSETPLLVTPEMSPTNKGYYEFDWFISGGIVISNQYKLRLVPVGEVGYLRSEDYFSITEKPIDAPWENADLKKGLTYDVEWRYSASVPTTFNIYLERPDQSSETVTTNLPFVNNGDQSYSWTVPIDTDTASDYRITVVPYESGVPQPIMASEGPFRISELPVYIPQEVTRGDNARISFGEYHNFEENTSFDIFLNQRSGESQWIANTGPLPANNGDHYTYNWMVDDGTDLQNDYLIRIVPSGNQPPLSTENPFAVVQNELIFPNGGEYLKEHETYDVRWTYHQPGTDFSISLIRITSTGSEELVQNTGPLNPIYDNVYSFPVQISSEQTDKRYKIHIYPNNPAGEGFRSEEPFTLICDTCEEPLKVIKPVSGEPLIKGNTYEIKWLGLFPTNSFEISYREMDRPTHDDHITNLNAVSADENGEYTYYWTVPNSMDIDDKYEIYIEPTNGNHSYVSDFLTIQENSGEPLYTTYPSGGEYFKKGHNYEITWDYFVGQNTSFDIYIQRPGYTDQQIGTTLPVTDFSRLNHSFTWDFDWNYGFEYSFRIVPDNGGNEIISKEFTICDECDGPLPFIFPNGGENLVHGQSYTVRWDVDGAISGNSVVYRERDNGSRSQIGYVNGEAMSWSAKSGGNQYHLFVQAGGKFYRSEEPFNVCSGAECVNPYEIIYPRGGEVFVYDEPIVISWTGVNERQTYIDLIDQNGTSNRLGSEYDISLYSWTWTPAATLAEGYYKIRLTNGSRVAESDEFYVGKAQELNAITSTTYTYDENGSPQILGQSKSFYDLNGKLLQSQTKNLQDEEVIAAQPIYDQFDRPALQTLPAPISFKNFVYRYDFVIASNGGEVYDWHDFDYLSNDAGYQPRALDYNGRGTLGNFYNHYNGSEGNEHIESSAFPFTLTEFYDDGTGEVHRSNAPGDDGITDHRNYVKTFPVLNDLDGKYLQIRNLMFNDNTSTLRNQLVKTVSRDANNKETIAYKDASGNVLASGYAFVEYGVKFTIDYNDEPVNTLGELSYFDFHLPEASYISISQSSAFGGYPAKAIKLSDNSYSSTIRYPGFYRCEECTSVDFKYDYYDMSFNFYDNQGRLRASVSPMGVAEILNTSSFDGTSVWQIPYTTYYTYDHEGRLIEMEEPDAGITKYMYRTDGTLRFSQNAQQLVDGNNFSYTDYDVYGRPVESGEYIGSIPYGSALVGSLENTGNNSWPAVDKKDVLNTYYDLPDDSPEVGLPGVQKNTYGAVSYSENENTKTWYSYDEFGRVDWMATWYKNIFSTSAKVISYDYDFTGNVTQVHYQEGKSDEFHHLYVYDKESRLSEVYAANYKLSASSLSEDELQAKYIYDVLGNLKRVELAKDLQGVDYYYTIEGWLSSINKLNDTNDQPGFKDDVFGQSYHYDERTSDWEVDNLYNGIIQGVAWYHENTSGQIKDYETFYDYDNKYQLKEAGPDENSSSQRYKGRVRNIQYDANGNLKTIWRHDANGDQQNSFRYNYNEGQNNRLSSVTKDFSSADDYAFYAYNAIGQMTQQTFANGDELNPTYDVSGKVTEIRDESGTLKVTNEYDDRGFRIRKIDHAVGGDIETVYVRDASGSLLTIYTKDVGASAYNQTETPVYGASRLGNWYHQSGDTEFELKDHLGNVRSKISRQTRDVVYLANYYPFGSVLYSEGIPGRYDYQGDFSEKDEETGWNHFELREYDAVVGRFTIVDPAKYQATPYSGMSNNPINAVDVRGDTTRFIFYMEHLTESEQTQLDNLGFWEGSDLISGLYYRDFDESDGRSTIPWAVISLDIYDNFDNETIRLGGKSGTRGRKIANFIPILKQSLRTSLKQVGDYKSIQNPLNDQDVINLFSKDLRDRYLQYANYVYPKRGSYHDSFWQYVDDKVFGEPSTYGFPNKKLYYFRRGRKNHGF